MNLESKEWAELIRFIDPVVGRPLTGKNEYCRDTDLYHDLDLEPKAIQALLNAWATRFDVDMTEFDLHHYYPADKLSKKDFFLTLGKVFFSKKAREKMGGWALTLGMMEEAMQRRKWIRALS